jgi:S1-C subfamily serine protease
VTLEVFRERKTIQKKVTLRARDESETIVRAVDKGGEEKEGSEDSSPLTLESLGLTLRNMTTTEREKYGLEKGVIVSDVRQFSEAFNRQITRGDAIVEIDKQDVGSPQEVREIVESRRPGDSVLFRLKRANGSSFYTALQIQG